MAALHSLPFIEWNEATRKFAVNEDGARYLSTFENKIGAARGGGGEAGGRGSNLLC